MKFYIGQKVKVVTKTGFYTRTSIRNVGDIFVINHLLDSDKVSQDDNADWCDSKDLSPVFTTIFTKLPKDHQ